MIDQPSLFDFDAPTTPTPGEPIALSVAAAVELINDQLFRIAGPNLVVEGEVAEYTLSQKKWVRFTLKDLDGSALLKCFLTIYQRSYYCTRDAEGVRALWHADTQHQFD